MDEATLEIFQAIRAGIQDGSTTASDALFLLENNKGSMGGMAAPNLVALILFWGGTFTEADLGQLSEIQKQDVDRFASFFSRDSFTKATPPAISSLVTDFDRLVQPVAQDAGQQQGPLTAAEVAETSEFSLPAQFEQFMALQGRQTEVQRRAAARQLLPLSTAYQLQNVQGMAAGDDPDAKASFLSFLQGQPDARSIQANALAALKNIYLGTPDEEKQSAIEFLVGEEGESLVRDIISGRVRPEFRGAAGRVASRNIMGQQAENIATGITSPGTTYEDPGVFQSWIQGMGGLPRPTFGPLRTRLAGAFAPGAGGGYTGEQEVAQEQLGRQDVGIPLIEQILRRKFAPGLRSSLSNVLARRAAAWQAQNPGGNVFGEFVRAGGGLGFT